MDSVDILMYVSVSDWHGVGHDDYRGGRAQPRRAVRGVGVRERGTGARPPDGLRRGGAGPGVGVDTGSSGPSVPGRARFGGSVRFVQVAVYPTLTPRRVPVVTVRSTRRAVGGAQGRVVLARAGIGRAA